MFIIRALLSNVRHTLSQKLVKLQTEAIVMQEWMRVQKKGLKCGKDRRFNRDV